MTILALDLAKSKSVFCVLDTVTGEVRFGHVLTRRDKLRKLVEAERPARVVIEVCPLAGWIHDLMREMKVMIEVADPTQDAWKYKHVKRKTDEDDALKLARLSAMGQLNLVYMPSVKMRQWRRLIETRHALVADRTRWKNRIRAILAQEELNWPSGCRGWSKERREQLQKMSRPMSECSLEDLWRAGLSAALQHLERIEELITELDAGLDRLAAADPRTKLVQTIPGVGARTAEAIVTAIDDASRFQNGRQVASYAGLVPRRFQSGQMDRQGRISKRGNQRLRQVLNQAGWMAVRHSQHLRAVFLRISGNRPGRRKLAIVAVMRKLLVIAWAMLRDNRCYRPPRSVAEPVTA